MYQEIKFVPYRPFGIFIGCCGIGMLLLGIAALVVPYLMIQHAPEPEGLDVLMMEECTRCRDKESKNWEDAAQKRIVQLEALEELKKNYEAEADTWRERAKWCSDQYDELFQKTAVCRTAETLKVKDGTH